MDPQKPEVPSTPETATQQINHLNSALLSYDKWNRENAAAAFRAGSVEQTPEAALGEKLTKARTDIFGIAETNFDSAVKTLGQSNDESPEAKLIKLHQARELLRFPGVSTTEGSAEKTLKVIEARPDLLTHLDLVKLLEQEMYDPGQNAPKIPERIVDNIKTVESTQKLEPRYLAVMEKISVAQPDSRSAVYLGLAEGINSANSTKPEIVGYFDALKNLPNQIKNSADVSPRGRAKFLSGAFATVYRAYDLISSRQNESLSGIKTAIPDELVKGIDALFPNQTTGELAKGTGPDAQLASFIDSFAKNVENGPIFKSLIDRNNKVRNKQIAEQDRITAEQKTKADAEAQKQQELAQQAQKLVEQQTAAKPPTPPVSLAKPDLALPDKPAPRKKIFGLF